MNQIAKNAWNNAQLARVILGLSVFTSGLITFVFDWDLLGIQYFLSALAVIGAFLIIAFKQGRAIHPYWWSLLGTTLCLSLFLSVRSSGFLIFLNIVLSIQLLSIVFLEFARLRPLKIFDYFFSTWIGPVIYLQALTPFIKNLARPATKGLSPTTKRVLSGVVIASPILIIFGSLFASADAVFADTISSLFSFDLNVSGELVGRSIAFITFTTLLISSLSYIWLLDKKQTSSVSKQADVTDKYSIEISVVLGLLSALFLFFIAIQALYLFGDRETVLNGTLTFAEYGRRGFFELLTIASLVFSLIVVLRQFTPLKNKSLPSMLTFGLIAQVGIIMLSAWRRLDLYENEFGQTTLRFFSQSFIFFLAAAFILLVGVLVKNYKNTQLFRAITLLVSAYVLVLNVINPDVLIAQRNLDRYDQTGKIDVSTISGLSSDAAAQQVEAAQIAETNPDIEIFEARNIFCFDKQYELRNDTNWSTFHLGRQSAETIFEEAGILSCDEYDQIRLEEIESGFQR